MDFPLLARRTAERLADRLQRHNALFLVAFLAVYFLLTARIAAHKSYWYDELYTLYISRAATPGEVWRELAAGADLNPPLCHLLTWASLRLFGESPVSVRLPAILGFALMLLCVHRFVARRCGVVYGWLAVLFLLCSRAFNYAYEARPYALVLGFCGLALVCWQGLTEGRHRR